MDYAEAREAFFQPRHGAAPPGLAQSGAPGRLLRDAIEPIAAICYWSEPVNNRYASAGLDFLGGYVWGRASVLGQPDPAVVAAAFGVFQPDLIADLYSDARQRCSLDAIRTARREGSLDALEQSMGRPDGLAEVAAIVRRGAEATPTMGRPLSAGIAGEAWPDDPLLALWQACSLLREYRGDSHLAVCVAANIDGIEANILTELAVGWDALSYTASRGWSDDDMSGAMGRLEKEGLVENGLLTVAGQQERARLEAATENLVQPVIDAIGSDLGPAVEALNSYSDAIIEAGWFPPDPYKRAAG